MARVQITLRDAGEELSSVAFTLVEPGAAIPYSDIESYKTTLRDAVLGVSLGELARAYISVADEQAGGVPANNFAQRELGLLIHMTDDVTGEKFVLTIPMPDLSILTLVDGDTVSLTAPAAMATLVTAIETNHKPRGNAVTVTKANVVGRNT